MRVPIMLNPLPIMDRLGVARCAFDARHLDDPFFHLAHGQYGQQVVHCNCARFHRKSSVDSSRA
jgi:hypothetical protein